MIFTTGHRFESNLVEVLEEEEEKEDVRVYLYMTNYGQDFWKLFMKVYVTML